MQVGSCVWGVMEGDQSIWGGGVVTLLVAGSPSEIPMNVGVFCRPLVIELSLLKIWVPLFDKVLDKSFIFITRNPKELLLDSSEKNLNTSS